MKKRLFTFILAMCLLTTALPVIRAQAASNADYRYTYLDAIENAWYDFTVNNGKFDVAYTRYYLEDLDGNGVPELFIAYPDLDWGIEIVSYYDGYYDSISYRTDTYHYTKGCSPCTIYGSYTMKGCTMSGKWKLHNGDFTSQGEWMHNFYNDTYYENGNQISANQYLMGSAMQFPMDQWGKILHGQVTYDYASWYTYEEITELLSRPFLDVPTDAWYYDSVQWATDQGITTGISATQFAPDQVCTRAQVVTFLWRAAGCPEPASYRHPFTDLESDSYYYKAVLWAVEQGITNGLTNTTFGPGKPCTRGQVVTFLHRYNGTPASYGSNPFVDVNSGAFYTNAVIWAVENGITTGMDSTHFEPDRTCTRSQIVTFLYRDATGVGNLFNETYWVWAKGPTNGSIFVALFHNDGTVEYCRATSLDYYTTTYTYSNNILTVDGIAYQYDGESFNTVNKHPAVMMPDGMHYNLSPVGDDSFWVGRLNESMQMYK